VNGVSAADRRASIAVIEELVATISARRTAATAGVADDLLMPALSPSVEGTIVGLRERERALIEKLVHEYAKLTVMRLPAR
jgi:hypothetical protein